MKISIRSKLVVAISLLMVVIFSLAANLFINEKKIEMADDIYSTVLDFSRLTSGKIADDYELYIAQNSFVYFNREIKALFAQNPYVSEFEVVNYKGEVLYDSKEDGAKRYEGIPREVQDKILLEQIKSENISLKTADKRVLFLKTEDGIKYFDKDEKPITSLATGTFIDYIIVPANEKYSVIYKLNYAPLEERIDAMIRRIVYLAIFAVMLGMLMSFVMAKNLTKPIKTLVDGTNEIAKGNFDVRVDVRSHDEMKILGDAFNKMAEDLKASMNAKLFQARVAHELEIATQIQQQIIPKTIPQIEGLDISAGIIPAGEIGGDMYDFLQTAPDKLIMYLGDVTGHGIPAGLISSIVNALFYAYIGESSLQKLMINVNRVLKAKSMSNMFMTLCLMEWNSTAKKMNYINAGHEEIIHYHAREKEVSLEGRGGIALGMVKDISAMVTVNSIDLQPGDFLVLYSDGIPETWKNQKEEYGMERLVALTKTLSNIDSSAGIKKAILADVELFAAGYQQMDDITIIVIKRV